MFITLQLWKKGCEEFSKEELNPIEKIFISENKNKVEIILKDGETKIVTFKSE